MKYDPVDRTAGCPYIIILWSKNYTEAQQQVHSLYYIYIYLLLASSLYGVQGVEEGGQVSGGEGGMTN